MGLMLTINDTIAALQEFQNNQLTGSIYVHTNDATPRVLDHGIVFISEPRTGRYDYVVVILPGDKAPKTYYRPSTRPAGLVARGLKRHREAIADLKGHLARLHEGQELPSDDELGASMRADDES